MSSSDIAIPNIDLVYWTELHLTALLQATTPEAVSEAIHNFLAKDARITVNGKSVSIDEYAQFAGPAIRKRGAQVKYDAAVGIPKDQKNQTKVSLSTGVPIFISPKRLCSITNIDHFTLHRAELLVCSLKPRWKPVLSSLEHQKLTRSLLQSMSCKSTTIVFN
jgi:hypothetical protein